MGDESDTYTVDEAYSAVGFGTFQVLALLFAGMGWFSEALEVSILSFIGPALKSEWLLSPYEESLLSTVVFGGMLGGACFWGFISDAYGRRTAIQGVCVLIFGAGILSSISPDYKSLVFLRFFLGFGAAGGHVFLSWFLEFLPSSNRGVWMLVMTCSWIFGELLEASVAWVVMPTLGWRWLLALSSLPSLILFVLSYFAPETPRYEFMKGRSIEATRTLEKISRINQKELPSGYLISHRRTPLDEENLLLEETSLISLRASTTTSFQKSLYSLCQLFSPDILRTTLLLWSLSFSYTFAYYGIQLMVSALSSSQDDCRMPNMLTTSTKDNDLYVNSFFTYLAELPGLLLAVVLVDRLGRKLCMEILALLTVIAILPLLFPQNGTVTMILLICGRMFLAASFNTFCVYSAEVYPTSVRTRGYGICSAVGRVGGMVCPLVAVGLVRGCHQTLAVGVFGLVILLSGICVIFFPFETRKRGLKDIDAH